MRPNRRTLADALLPSPAPVLPLAGPRPWGSLLGGLVALGAALYLMSCDADPAPAPDCRLPDGTHLMQLAKVSGNCAELPDITFTEPSPPGSGCVSVTDPTSCAHEARCMLPVDGGGTLETYATGTMGSAAGSGSLQVTLTDAAGAVVCAGTYDWELALAGG